MWHGKSMPQPDISHLDQLCIIFRYVDHDNLPVERFLAFIPAHSHRSEYLFETISACLGNLTLDIMDCRGQSYDNASNMAGRYSGLQARLKAVNPYACYVPCAAHSLNLVGSNAVEANGSVLKFFCLVQEIYNFFAGSTHRWQLVNDNIRGKNATFLTLKSRSSTRWSADAEAVKALHKNYESICETLTAIACNENETSVTRKEARSLYDGLNKLETVVSMIVWDTILQRLNATNKTVQNTSVNLSILPNLFQSLIDFIQFVRENYDSYEQEALAILPGATYKVVRKRNVPCSRWLDDKNAPATNFSPREEFIVSCHYALCDSLISHLNKRKEPYTKMIELFQCFINLQNSVSLNEAAKVLIEAYPSDLSEDLSNELAQFKSLITSTNRCESVTDMFILLKELNLSSSFPNVDTALRTFLSIPIQGPIML